MKKARKKPSLKEEFNHSHCCSGEDWGGTSHNPARHCELCLLTLMLWAVQLLLVHTVVQPESQLGAHCSMQHAGCGVSCSEAIGRVDIPENCLCPEAEMHPQNSLRCCQEQLSQRKTFCTPVGITAPSPGVSQQ